MQAVVASTLATVAMTTGLVPSHDVAQEVRHDAELQHAADDKDTTQQPAACPQQDASTAHAAGCADSSSAQATATGASTMFGAFKIPASLQVDHLRGVPQLIAAYSSSGGSGNGSSAGGKSKPANYSYLPQTFIGSSSGGVSGIAQQAQVFSVLNAGYCSSPLGLSAAQKLEQQQHQLHEHLQHLPASKQRQTLQWLQHGSSGSCPESDGPQTSPCYSWDSAQLLSLGGASSQVLPLLQQQQSAASPASGGGSSRIQLGSAAGSLQGVLQQVWSGAGSAHWAAQLVAAPAQQRGQYVGSPLGPGVAAVAVGGSGQTYMPFSRLHISRSVSLPATHGRFGAAGDTPAQSSQAADPSDALAQLLAHGPDCAGAQGAQTIPDEAGQLQCNSNSEGYSSGNNAVSSEMCSSEEQHRVVLGPGSVSQLAAGLQDQAAAGAESSAQSPATAPEKQQKVSWGAASFRSIAAAFSTVTHSFSNRSRAVSIAGNISEQAVAATETSSPTPAPEAAASGSDNSSPPEKSGASMRSMQSTRRRDSSFSMRHSFGSAFGSFAGRSTWSEFEPPFSVATVDSEDGDGVPAPAAAAEADANAAEHQQQQLLQQDGWRMRSSKEAAAGLTPVLSANSEDLKRLAAQEQPESEASRALADLCSFRTPLADQRQQAQVQEQVQQAAPTDEGVLDMHAAYQIALRSTASEGGRKLSRDAQAAVLPTIHSIDAHSADKQPACSASRTQSWLIASAPAAAAAGEASPWSAPADSAGAAAAGSSSPYDTAFPPLSVRVPSPADQTLGAAGARQHAHLVQQPHWRMQLLHGSQPLSAAAGTPQSASAPQLHHDDYAVRSPTASVASLSSHFSHGTINSYWWLDGCGGSPSAARSRQQTPSPVPSDQPQLSTSGVPAFEPGSSVSGGVSSTGFKFPAAAQPCAQSCGSPVGQVLAGSAPGCCPGCFPASPAAAVSPMSARISAGLALRPAVIHRPSSAASVMEAASKLSNTASLNRGDLPHVSQQHTAVFRKQSPAILFFSVLLSYVLCRFTRLLERCCQQCMLGRSG